jgi:hypothetical protein
MSLRLRRLSLIFKSMLYLILISLLFFPLAASAQTWQWALEEIDLSGMGTSIVADQDANLHVSYYWPTSGQLRYAFRPAGSSKWYKMALDSGLNTTETAITVDAAGNPQICYPATAIKYARWDGRRWSTQEIDPGSGLISFTCSIQVDSVGRPMITWYLVGRYLRYAVLQDGAWLARSLDGGNGHEPGKWNSMALDSRGFPHVAYSSWPIGQLKYARFDGKIWLDSVVDAPDPRNYSGGQRCMGNSLVLDSKGNPLISYYDEESLRLARLVDGVWKKEIVEKLPPFGNKWDWKNFRSSLVLDSKGFPHIGFESRSGLEHAWWDGHQWNTQLLVSTLGSPRFENSMTIDRDDNLYMTFRDPTVGSLSLAIGRPTPASQTALENDSARRTNK